MLTAQVRWTSEAPSVLRVDSLSGWVRALGPGTGTIRARVGAGDDAISDGLSLSVLSVATGGHLEVGGAPLACQTIGVADTTAAIVAVATDARGAVVTGRPVAWSTSSSTVLGLSPAPNGAVRVVGRAAGTATLTATVDTVHLTVAFTVSAPATPSDSTSPPAVTHPGILHHVTIAPRPGAPVTVGDTLTLHARAYDDAGTPLPLELDWYELYQSPRLIQVVGVLDSGRTALVTAVRPGRQVVAAWAEQDDPDYRYVEDTLTVQVVTAPVLRVRASPQAMVLPVGGAGVPLTVSVASPSGAPLSDATVTYTSTNEQIAVSPSGVVTSATGGESGLILVQAVRNRLVGVDTVRVSTDGSASLLTITLSDTVLSPGATLRIQGEGLSGATVEVAGVSAPVLSQTGAELTATVPASLFAPCVRPNSAFPVTVTTSSGTVLANAPALAVAYPVSLSAGQHAWVSDPTTMRGCELELPSGGEYLVMPYALPELRPSVVGSGYDYSQFALGLSARPAPAALAGARLAGHMGAGLRLSPVRFTRGSAALRAALALPYTRVARLAPIGPRGVLARPARRPAVLPAVPARPRAHPRRYLDAVGEMSIEAVRRQMHQAPTVRPGVAGVPQRLSVWRRQAGLAAGALTARVGRTLGSPAFARLLDGSSCAAPGAMGDTMPLRTLRYPYQSWIPAYQQGQVEGLSAVTETPDSTGITGYGWAYGEEPWTVAVATAHLTVVIDSTYARVAAGDPSALTDLQTMAAEYEASTPAVLSRWGLALPDGDGNGRLVVLVPWATWGMRPQTLPTTDGAYGRVGCDNGEAVLLPVPALHAVPGALPASYGYTRPGDTPVDGVTTINHLVGHLLANTASPTFWAGLYTPKFHEAFASFFEHLWVTRDEPSPFAGNRTEIPRARVGAAMGQPLACIDPNPAVALALSEIVSGAESGPRLCWFDLRLATALHDAGRSDPQVAAALLANLDQGTPTQYWNAALGASASSDEVYGTWMFSMYTDDRVSGTTATLTDPAWNVSSIITAQQASWGPVYFPYMPAGYPDTYLQYTPASSADTTQKNVYGGQSVYSTVDARTRSMRLSVLTWDGRIVADSSLRVGVLRVR